MHMAVSGTRPSGATGGTAPDRIHADLRERIIEFDLPPGSTLGRNELAEHYHVSQTPIREALQRLEQEGLVLIYPQSKTVVSRIGVRQLYETQFLRVAVETEVVRRLAEGRYPDVIRRAQVFIDMQRTLLERDGDMSMFGDLDRSFHTTLFEGLGMENLNLMLRKRLGHLYRCQRLELPQEGKMKTIVDAHQAILDGISVGNPDRAVEAMRLHLSGTISRVESLRAQFPEYFSKDEIV